MLQRHSILRPRFRKYFVLSALATAALLVGNSGWAGEGTDDRATRLIKVIPVPPSKTNNTAGGLYSYDIAWVDQASQKYYLADRSHNVVQVVEAKTGSLLPPLSATPPFAGTSPPAFATTNAGPNGVV